MAPISLSARAKRLAAAGPQALDVLVLLNPVAARSESGGVREAIDAALVANGKRARVVLTNELDDVPKGVAREIRRAVAAGCTRIIAVGGDGTVALAGAALIRQSEGSPTATIAIVPTGTANVLARELGVPLTIPEAITLAFEGEEVIELDAIDAGGLPVFTQVGVGLDAKMIRHTSREDQIQNGRLAYARTFLQRAMSHRSATFDLTVDGQHLRVRAYQIIVANIGALGAPPFTYGPGIDPSDGAIDLCIYTARTPLDHVILVWRLITGQHQRDAHTRYISVKRSVVIDGHPPMLVQGDGEILGRTPITLKVLPRVIRICVPKEVESLVPVVGSPDDPATRGKKAIAQHRTSADEPTETIAREVEVMVSQYSRTWVLQGWLRHPFAFLAALDAALYMRVNAMKLGRLSDRALEWISTFMHYGEGWIVVAVGMFIADRTTALRAVSEALPVLWATMLTVNFPLKQIFRRRRPFIAFVRARVLGPKPKDFSFPSGHTAAAFAGALLFGAHLPILAPLFYAIAVVVGFSRIYLGVHYPSDVFIGAIVGSSLAGFYLMLWRALVAALGWHA